MPGLSNTAFCVAVTFICIVVASFAGITMGRGLQCAALKKAIERSGGATPVRFTITGGCQVQVLGTAEWRRVANAHR
jgi:hypothetical protein